LSFYGSSGIFRSVAPNGTSGQAAPVTLGDLLYADRGERPISEDDWVRLVERMATGDQRALKLLYERTNRLVFTLAMRISRNHELAEEITVDVFHDVWRRAANYDPQGGCVIGWIMNQARSRAIDRLRFEQRKKRTAPPKEAIAEEQTPVPEPAEVVDSERRHNVLHEALTVLTSDERQAIETAFFAELTYAETAARLEQPIGTVKTRIRSALAKLREALPGEGGGP
jgi:RNA polymerase sigma-70 factor (ECF subfamily)